MSGLFCLVRLSLLSLSLKSEMLVSQISATNQHEKGNLNICRSEIIDENNVRMKMREFGTSTTRSRFDLDRILRLLTWGYSPLKLAFLWLGSGTNHYRHWLLGEVCLTISNHKICTKAFAPHRIFYHYCNVWIYENLIDFLLHQIERFFSILPVQGVHKFAVGCW